MKIAVAGTGYAGISNGILLAQHNEAYEGVENIVIATPIDREFL